MGRTRTILVLLGIVVVAVLARFAWVYWTDTTPAGFTDAQYYDATARSVAGGDGYSVQFDTDEGFLRGGEPTAFWPPGYSVALGATYKIFGDSFGVARGLNAVAGALTVIPVFFIGRRFFGQIEGLLAAFMAALLPSLVFWTPVLLSETVFTFFFASALAMILHATGDDGALRPMPMLLAGLLISLAVMIRGQGLVLLGFAPIWFLMSRVTLRTASMATLALASVVVLFVLPWSVRNQARMDATVILSANAGYNLRVGHAPYATGRYILPDDLWNAEPGLTFHQREILFNELGRERAWDYAFSHVGREIELLGRKVMWLWRPDSESLRWATGFGKDPLPAGAWEPLRLTLDITYLLVVASLIAALAFVRRDPRHGIIAVIVLAAFWTATHVVFFSEPRFHVPLLAAILPVSAFVFTRTCKGCMDLLRSVT